MGSSRTTWAPVVGLVALAGIFTLKGLATLWGADGPEPTAVDWTAWGVASALKVVVLGAMAVTLARTYGLMSRCRSTAGPIFTLWITTAVVVLLALAVTREHWAPLATTAATKYYPVDVPALKQRGHYIRWEQQWSSGIVVAAELGLAFVLALLHRIVGRALGHRPTLAVVVGAAWTVAVLFFVVSLSGFVDFDYDTFHGDLIAGAVLLDLVFPVMTLEPYTFVAGAVYAGVLGSSWVALRAARRGGA